MSGLSQAVPLALAAAVYPPAILVCALLLTGDRPRLLLSAYLVGAAAVTITVGLAGLVVLEGAGVAESQSRSTSATLDLALGVVLLAVSAWMWPRRHRPAKDPDASAGEGRIAQLTGRARSSARWALALGVLMYLPSPLYLAAIKAVADAGGTTGGKVGAILICAACVLLFVEVPFVALMLAPDGLERRLDSFQTALSRHAWTIAAVLFAGAGVFLTVSGLTELL